MGIMDQAIEDGIGDGGIANLFVPVCHRQLTGDDSGCMPVSFFDDL